MHSITVTSLLTLLGLAVCLFLLPQAAAGQRADLDLYVETGHTNTINQVVWSRNGKLIASASKDQTVKLYDAATRRELATLRHPSEIGFIAFSPDSKLLAATGGRMIFVWDVQTGKVVGTIKGFGWFSSTVAFSPDGKTLAYRGNIDKLNNDTLIFWNIGSRSEPITIKADNGANIIDYSPDGKILAGTGDHIVTLWDVATKSKLKNLKGHKYSIHSIKFSPDGKTLATGDRDATIKLWDVATGKLLHNLYGHRSDVASVDFSPDGQMLASGSGKGGTDRMIKFWDVSSGREVASITTDSAVYSVSFSPDGKTLAAATGRQLSFLDVASKTLLSKSGTHAEEITTVAYSPDGKTIATGGSGSTTIKLWNLYGEQQLRTLAGHTRGVGSVIFSPDGRLLASLGVFPEYVIKIWDVATGALRLRIDAEPYLLSESLTDATFSPDGKMLASADGEGIKLWDVSSGRLLKTLTEKKGLGYFSVAFSPGGETLASGGPGRSLILWNVTTGQQLRSFPVKNFSVLKLAFSADGKTLASRGLNGAVGVEDTTDLWNVATGSNLKSYLSNAPEVKSEILAAVPDFYTRDRFEPVSPDGKTEVSRRLNGVISLVQRSTGKDLVSFAARSGGDWVVIKPDGRFDTSSLEKTRGLNWVMSDDWLNPLPLEIFMRDYYEPRLLHRVIEGEKFPELSSPAGLNRVQPKVNEISVIPRHDNPDMVDVKVKVTSAIGKCADAGRRAPCESGVYDLRLYRDGRLVSQSPQPDFKSIAGNGAGRERLEQIQQWRETSLVRTLDGVPVTAAGGAREVTLYGIQLPRRPGITQAVFTAYAFNKDRVKSATSEPVIHKLERPRPALKPRAYIVTVGVDVTSDPSVRLVFAPTSAREVERLLKEMLQSEYEMVTVPLISENKENSNELAQDLATKVNIRAALNILSGEEVNPAIRRPLPNQDKLKSATPDDIVVLYIASHGYADPGGNFYVLPSDIGAPAGVDEELLDQCLKNPEQAESCRLAREHLERSISSNELARWLHSIDAEQMVLILDSCHSGAVSGPAFKPGPMGDRSFGQLSYDKGMLVLAATQAENVALGTLGLGDRSLLTEALNKSEQLGRQQRFDLRRWLMEARELVPELHRRHVSQRTLQGQEPVLFDFARQ